MLREVKVYLIDAMSSNSMKSSNPHSGIHEAEVTKCLDTMCLDPGCNQGGCMVCIALEGNGARPSHLGKGFSEDGTMYTLNTIEQHSVCFRKSCKPYGKDGLGERWVEDDIVNTLNCFEFNSDTRTPEIIVQKQHTYSVDCRNGCLNEELSITLQAKNQGGFSVNCTPPILRLADDESTSI